MILNDFQEEEDVIQQFNANTIVDEVLLGKSQLIIMYILLFNNEFKTKIDEV